MVTLSNEALEARAVEALNMIAEARALELQARAVIAEAMKLAKDVLKQTDAPWLYNKELSIIIYPKHPVNIRGAGQSPITHARTEATTAAALKQIQSRVTEHKYSLAVAEVNRLNQKAWVKKEADLGRDIVRNKHTGETKVVRNNPYGI